MAASLEPAGRRSDAQRNRLRILDAASRAFAAGTDDAALESIARDAGVGIATLYRNFPTRETLVEAVYADEFDAVLSGMDELLATARADEALEAWLSRYAEFLRTKRAVHHALRASRTDQRVAQTGAPERVAAVMATVLRAGVKDGSLREDVTGEELAILLLGVILATDLGEDEDRTRRLFGLVVDSVRARPDDRA